MLMEWKNVDTVFNPAYNVDNYIRDVRFVKDVFDWSSYYEQSGVRCYTDNGRYYIEAEVPGFIKTDLSVTYDNNVLSIIGNKKINGNDRNIKYSISCPKNVNISTATAVANDGILLISFDVSNTKTSIEIK
mgnify:FL=1